MSIEESWNMGGGVSSLSRVGYKGSLKDLALVTLRCGNPDEIIACCQFSVLCCGSRYLLLERLSVTEAPRPYFMSGIKLLSGATSSPLSAKALLFRSMLEP